LPSRTDWLLSASRRDAGLLQNQEAIRAKGVGAIR
jgi:hypothetical protein